jgi:hypothetical protein
MKKVRIASGRSHYRIIEVPETFEEAHNMLVEAMDNKHDASGGDAYRNSIAGRVAFALLFMETDNPTIALNYLLRQFCKNKGKIY